MSQTAVGKVVERLLTDENLRLRFALDRIETAPSSVCRGFGLSREDIDLFCRTDARLWFLGDIASGERPHRGRPDDVRLPRWPTRDHTRTRVSGGGLDVAG